MIMEEFVAKYKTVPCDEKTLKRHGWKRFVLETRTNKKHIKLEK